MVEEFKIKGHMQRSFELEQRKVFSKGQETNLFNTERIFTVTLDFTSNLLGSQRKARDRSIFHLQTHHIFFPTWTFACAFSLNWN